MLPETKGWPQKRAGWERQWHQKLFGVPTSCDGMGFSKLPNSWTAHWRSPAGSEPVPVFLQCLGLPTEHLDIWRGLGQSLDIPYLSRTALQAPTSIVDCPGKWTGHSTSLGHKSHSTSKCLLPDAQTHLVPKTTLLELVSPKRLRIAHCDLEVSSVHWKQAVISDVSHLPVIKLNLKRSKT